MFEKEQRYRWCAMPCAALARSGLDHIPRDLLRFNAFDCCTVIFKCRAATMTLELSSVR